MLDALEGTVRALDPAVDTVMVFAPAGEELRCVHAGGRRAEHYAAWSLRRDDPALLPAKAAQCLHRVELRPDDRAIVPTDRYALAAPMIAGSDLAAIVYAASARTAIAEKESIVRAVSHAAAPYLIASERESDRAQATYDGLTGLYTPRAFRRRLQEEAALAQAGARGTFAVWFIDTDHFKRVNDTLGHAAGDAVLQAMAAVLQAHTYDGIDVAARNGGDEFCAVLRDVQKIAAIDRAQRFCEAVAAHDFTSGVRITASIGVAAFPADAKTANELLEIADAAMYHSKGSGRDCVSFAAPGGGFAVYR